MNAREPAIEKTAMQVGLLMESAHVHQQIAEGQLEKLREHTRDLDSVVRDEIRRTLVEELQMVTAEAARATRALEKMRRGAGRRSAVLGLSAALLCALLPLAVARWALPSPAEVAALRVRREELAAGVAKLEQLGGRIDWRRCGESKRLCVRVDRKAPAYGERADYYVIEGY